MNRLTLLSLLLITVFRCVCAETAHSSGGRSYRAMSNGSSIPIPTTFFGMMINRRTLPWPSAIGVPIGSLRLWDTYTRWQDLNPSQSNYNWSNLDKWLQSAKANGVADIVLTLGGTPRWVSSKPNDRDCDYAVQTPGSCDPPMDLNRDGAGANQAWRNFLYNVAIHIKSLSSSTYSKPAYFEVWNEFTRMVQPPFAWRGSPAQLARMSQDAMCIVKGLGTIAVTREACTAANMHVSAVGVLPGAMILSPSAGLRGQSSRHQAYFSTPGAVAGADVLTIHSYAQTGHCCVEAEDAIPLHNFTMGRMPTSALGLPLWVTEGSWGMELNLPDDNLEAAYVARAHLISWAIGIQRYYWDGWNLANLYGALWFSNRVHGCNDGGTGKGCLSKPGAAYAQIYRWMVGNTMTEPCQGPVSSFKGVWTCGLTKPDGTPVLAIWDSARSCSGGSCTYSKYSPDPMYKRYYDLDGPTPHAVTGTIIQIGAKPILLEAGQR